jgi:hypothetical protein
MPHNTDIGLFTKPSFKTAARLSLPGSRIQKGNPETPAEM